MEATSLEILSRQNCASRQVGHVIVSSFNWFSITSCISSIRSSLMVKRQVQIWANDRQTVGTRRSQGRTCHPLDELTFLKPWPIFNRQCSQEHRWFRGPKKHAHTDRNHEPTDRSDWWFMSYSYLDSTLSNCWFHTPLYYSTVPRQPGQQPDA